MCALLTGGLFNICARLQKSYGQWQIVFGVLACTYLFGGFVYVLLGSGELQPWNNAPEKPEDADVEEEVPLKKNNIAVN